MSDGRSSRSLQLSDLRGDRRRVRTEARRPGRCSRRRRRSRSLISAADRLVARPGDVHLRHPGRVVDGAVLRRLVPPPGRLRHPDAARRQRYGSRSIAMVDRRARRARRRRSTSPSTPAPGAQGAQADPRGPGRHPERGARLLRRRRHRPVDRAAASPTRRPVQPDRRPGIGVGILSIPLVASVSEDALRSRAPARCGRRATAWAPARSPPSLRVVLPGRRVGPGGRVHPRRLPGHRRDDGRVHRRRRRRRHRCSSSSPLEPGLTHDRGHGLAGRRAPTQCVGEALTFQSLYFVGVVLFVITLVLNLVADRFVRRVRQAY